MEFKLKEMLVEGKFGPISLGDPKRKVIEVLGEPDCEIGESTSDWSGLLFGDIEVFFEQDTVVTIHIHQFGGCPKISGPHSFDPWIVQRSIPLRKFVEALKKEKIEFKAFFWHWTQEVIELHLYKYGYAVFDASESPGFQLEHVNLSQHISPNLIPIPSLEEHL